LSAQSWLRLALATGNRAAKIQPLLDRFGDADSAVAAGRNELAGCGLTDSELRRISSGEDKVLAHSEAWLDRAGHLLLAMTDERYPVLLGEIPDAPAVLFIRGNPEILSLPQFAIVGSRSATAGGRETARNFAAHLAGNGFCIASGLAVGIDAAAHRGALTAGGFTVAVFATGPDIVYPREHAALADEVAGSGALVSEYPPGTGPRRGRFPTRNRIISGISVGTLVVEAGLRSGAMITARLAAEQGREVFAVPGSIHNPVARGCHRLIRGGAKLVETSTDIVEELSGTLGRIAAAVEQNELAAAPRATIRDDPEYQRLLELMGWDPVDADTLVARSGLTAEQVSSMLLMLELSDIVEPLAGGRYLQREEGRPK